MQMNRNMAHVGVWGLGTPADSDCYGFRQFIEGIALSEGSKSFFYAYDQLPPEHLCLQILEDTEACTGLTLYGHSHGGAFLKFFLDWISVNRPAIKVSLAFFMDPAPCPNFMQFFSWQAADASLKNRWHIPLNAVIQAICFYQRNEQIVPGIIAVCGVPFVPDPFVSDTWCSGDKLPEVSGNIINFNVTGWNLYHCHMLADKRVQQLILRALLLSSPAALSTTGNGTA
jgi:hypothetical protein